MKYILSLLFLTLSLLVLATSLYSSYKAQAKSPPVVVCEPWAETKQWALDKCHDENDDIVCIVASSGMEQCRFE